MRYIKIAFDIFSNKRVMNIFIIIELAISLCFSVMVISIIDKEYKYYSLTKNINEAYVYMSEDNILDESSLLYKYQKEKKINVTRFREEDIWGYNANIEDPYQSYILSDYKIDGVYPVDHIQEEVMKNNLKKGRWFNTNTYDDLDNVVECVIIGDENIFPIGSIIDGATFEIEYDKNNNLLNWTIITKYKFKVVGTLGISSDLFSFKKQVYPPESLLVRDMFKEVSYGTNNFFEKLSIFNTSQENKNENKVSILCSYEDIYNDKLNENGMFASIEKNAMFTFSSNISNLEKNEIIDSLRKEASVTSFENTKHNESKLALNAITSYLPLVICFSFITIAALICTSILTYISNKKMYDTFIICGMNYKDGIKINRLYSLIIILSSSIISFLIWIVLSIFELLPWKNMSFSNSMLVYIIVNIIFNFSIINIVNYYVLRKQYKNENT